MNSSELNKFQELKAQLEDLSKRGAGPHNVRGFAQIQDMLWSKRDAVQKYGAEKTYPLSEKQVAFAEDVLAKALEFVQANEAAIERRHAELNAEDAAAKSVPAAQPAEVATLDAASSFEFQPADGLYEIEIDASKQPSWFASDVRNVSQKFVVIRGAFYRVLADINGKLYADWYMRWGDKAYRLSSLWDDAGTTLAVATVRRLPDPQYQTVKAGFIASNRNMERMWESS
jgi:hypothetical protein